MDKFLELIENKRMQLTVLNRSLDTSNTNLLELSIKKDKIEQEILDLETEYVKNQGLILKMIKFPMMKQEIIREAMLAVLKNSIPIFLTSILISLLLQLPMVLFFSVLLSIFCLGSDEYKKVKIFIDLYNEEIGNLTIEGLEQRNDFISEKKKS